MKWKLTECRLRYLAVPYQVVQSDGLIHNLLNSNLNSSPSLSTHYYLSCVHEWCLPMPIIEQREYTQRVANKRKKYMKEKKRSRGFGKEIIKGFKLCSRSIKRSEKMQASADSLAKVTSTLYIFFRFGIWKFDLFRSARLTWRSSERKRHTHGTTSRTFRVDDSLVGI